MLSYYMSPYMMFVENIDVLVRNTDEGFWLTKFGEFFQTFKKEFVPAHPLPYSWNEVTGVIAVIRSDDSYTSETGNLDGRGIYGSDTLLPTKDSNSFFDVMHHTISDQAVSFFKSGDITEKSIRQFDKRTKENLETLPLINGVGVEIEETCHPIFYPLNNTLVFDQYVKEEDIQTASLIILCGSRLSNSTPDVIASLVSKGATAIIPTYFSSAFAKYQHIQGDGKFIFVNNFSDNIFQNAITPYIGNKDEWKVKFENYLLTISNPSGDGRTLDFSLTE